MDFLENIGTLIENIINAKADGVTLYVGMLIGALLIVVPVVAVGILQYLIRDAMW